MPHPGVKPGEQKMHTDMSRPDRRRRLRPWYFLLVLQAFGSPLWKDALFNPGEGIGLGSIALIVLRMILFLTLGVVFGFIFLPRLSRKIDHLPISQGVIAFAIVIILFFGWTAEVLIITTLLALLLLRYLFIKTKPPKEFLSHEESGAEA
jgi:hypothetical protein